MILISIIPHFSLQNFVLPPRWRYPYFRRILELSDTRDHNFHTRIRNGQSRKIWGSHTQTAALSEIHTAREKFRDTYYKMKKVD
jgi:hypothetical protein